MKKGLFALVVCLGVAACGDGGKIEQAVRENLNDPDSAQFRDLVMSEDGRMACVGWNAKNMMGGYGQWKFARLEEVDSVWTVDEMEIPESECTQAALKAITVGAAAKIDATQKAIDMLSAARGVSRESAVKLADYSGGECGALVWQYSFSYSMIESARVVNNSGEINWYAKRIEPLEEMLKKGDCSKSSGELRGLF